MHTVRPTPFLCILIIACPCLQDAVESVTPMCQREEKGTSTCPLSPGVLSLPPSLGLEPGPRWGWGHCEQSSSLPAACTSLPAAWRRDSWGVGVGLGDVYHRPNTHPSPWHAYCIEDSLPKVSFQDVFLLLYVPRHVAQCEKKGGLAIQAVAATRGGQGVGEWEEKPDTIGFLLSCFLLPSRLSAFYKRTLSPGMAGP